MSTKLQDFNRLFRQYHRLILRYFVNRGVDPEEAADLAQETFSNAYAGLDSYRGESSERSWLFAIAKNVWRNRMRDQSRLKRDAPETPLDDLMEKGWEPPSQGEIDSDPLAEILNDERQQKIWEAIAELPPQMRRCFMLRVGQDRKYREIAEIMQISIQTVRSQLSQGRSYLHRLLSDYFEEN